MTKHQVKKATREDLWRLSQFFKDNYTGSGRYGTMDQFAWKTFENPVQGGFIHYAEIDGDIAFTTSITPKTLYLNNKPIPCAEIGDTYTGAGYFRKGLFPIVGNAAREEAAQSGKEYIYGLPNELALPGWLKRNGFILQPSLNVRELSIPLSAHNRLRKLLGWVGAELFSGTYKILARGLAIIKSPKKRYRVEKSTTIPEGWGAFWQAASKQYDYIVDRDKAALAWRYIKHHDHYDILTIYDHDQLVGYTVHKNKPSDLGYTLVIADFLFLPDHPQALHAALDEIFRLSFASITRSINLWCQKTSPYYKIFCDRGFKDGGPIPVISYAHDFNDEINQVTSPHFTMGDSDNV